MFFFCFLIKFEKLAKAQKETLNKACRITWNLFVLRTKIFLLLSCTMFGLVFTTSLMKRHRVGCEHESNFSLDHHRFLWRLRMKIVVDRERLRLLVHVLYDL